MAEKKKWTEEQAKLMERFKAERGYWSSGLWEIVLENDPGFLEQYLNFSSYPNKKGKIPKKYKELIYIAINASTTHLYEPALRQHIRNALQAGVTKAEILEVLEMISVLGIHACTLGVPVLEEESKKIG
jgi:alkylhydroperoxidase/carboxymuconolactone decarboxylase family protein YurZ